MDILNLEKFHQNRRARFGLIYLTFLVMLIHLPITASILLKSDYGLHAIFSENIRIYGQFQTGQHQSISYPLYHFTTNLFVTLAGQSSSVVNYGFAMTAGLTITLIFRIMTAHIIYITMCVVSPKDVTPRLMMFYVFLTGGLLIFGPISLFNLDNAMFITGYIQGNVYHSSTTLVVIPFGLLIFLASMFVFSDKKLKPIFTLIIVFLAGITVLAKPIFTIGFIPALILLIMIRQLRKQTVQWQIAFAIVIPSILTLAGQFFLTYSSVGGGIALRPFYVPLAQNGSYIVIFAKVFVSLIFPILVVMLYPDALKENMIILAWIFLAVAISYDWLLVEDGVRLLHRNFQWTGVTANFILFTVHILYLVKHHSDEMLSQKWTWKMRAVFGIFGLHGIFGIYFYIFWSSLPN